MPRKAIDYSNTIIYKLCCNDPSITDIYVGHTTNFTNRKRQHKQNCYNEKDKHYNIYVYQFIKEHGGWTNWSMIELEKINCIDGNDARKHERRHFELLGATLNTDIPSRTQTEYYEEHKDTIKEYNKKYSKENTDKIKEHRKKYRETNKDIIKEKKKKYHEENKDTRKEYREENKDKINERQRKYYEVNRDKLNERRRELCKQRKLETEKLVDIIVDINV